MTKLCKGLLRAVQAVLLLALFPLISCTTEQPSEQGSLPNSAPKMAAIDFSEIIYKRIETHDSDMAYIDVGSGDPIVLLHGNPTNSFIWRDIIPYLIPYGRILAPDLIGFGRSGKSPSSAYRFADHANYLDAWFDQVVPEGRIILVGQDWGVQFVMDWANRNRERVKGIVFTEGTIRPRRWQEFPEETQTLFRMIRDENNTENLLKANAMVNKGLLKGLQRELTEDEVEAYIRPFAEVEHRLPTIVLPRELPLDGEPADVAERIAAYADWMAQNQLPKLFFSATEGVAIIGEDLKFVRAWHNQTEVELQAGHFVPEDKPHEMGRAIANWLADLSKE